MRLDGPSRGARLLIGRKNSRRTLGTLVHCVSVIGLHDSSYRPPCFKWIDAFTRVDGLRGWYSVSSIHWLLSKPLAVNSWR